MHYLEWLKVPPKICPSMIWYVAITYALFWLARICSVHCGTWFYYYKSVLLLLFFMYILVNAVEPCRNLKVAIISPSSIQDLLQIDKILTFELYKETSDQRSRYIWYRWFVLCQWTSHSNTTWNPKLEIWDVHFKKNTSMIVCLSRIC